MTRTGSLPAPPARRVAQPSATPGPARPVRSSLASASVRYSRPSRDALRAALPGPGMPGTGMAFTSRPPPRASPERKEVSMLPVRRLPTAAPSSRTGC
jgi:hypothetical protein